MDRWSARRGKPARVIGVSLTRFPHNHTDVFSQENAWMSQLKSLFQTAPG
jgi:hypothetical protein